jgi:hypothetical protein
MRARSTVVVVGALLAAVALFVVLQDDEDDPASPRSAQPATSGGRPNEPEEPKQPSIPTIHLKGGEVIGGPQEIEVEKDSRARFDVRSDVAGEVHVHAYELFFDVVADRLNEIEFPASLEGSFEVELHWHDKAGTERESPLAELIVSP